MTPLYSTSPSTANRIKNFEAAGGPKLTAYKCPAGVWTIGYGATGPGIMAGVVWSSERCESRFAMDLFETEIAVSQLLAGSAFGTSREQYEALVSFAYNVGPDIDSDEIAEGLGDSSLLKKHRAGQYEAVLGEFAKWVWAGRGKAKKKLPGLITRRAWEAQLYKSGSPR